MTKYTDVAFPTSNDKSCAGLTKLELLTALILPQLLHPQDNIPDIIDICIKHAKVIIDKCSEDNKNGS